MKDLPSKEHYPYKIHTLLTKSSAYPPSTDNPLLYGHFYKNILIPPFCDFSEIPFPPINKGGRVHTVQTHPLYLIILWGLRLKVYLRYKTITSQNKSPEAQIKNFFIS